MADTEIHGLMRLTLSSTSCTGAASGWVLSILRGTMGYD